MRVILTVTGHDHRSVTFAPGELDASFGLEPLHLRAAASPASRRATPSTHQGQNCQRLGIRPTHRLLIFANVVTSALNVADPLAVAESAQHASRPVEAPRDSTVGDSLQQVEQGMSFRRVEVAEEIVVHTTSE